MENCETAVKSPLTGNNVEDEYNHTDDGKSKDRQQNRLGAISRPVHSYVNSTTFHGFNQIITAKSIWTKIFWILTMLVVFVIVFAQLRNLLRYFMENPTLTSIDVEYPKDGLEIPSLTICTLSKINHTAVRMYYPEVNQTLTEFSTASFLSAYSTALMDLGYFKRRGMHGAALQSALVNALDGKNISQYLHDVTFRCKGQLLLCWFENGEITDCCKDDGLVTVKRHLIHSGPCFEFIVKPGTRQRLPGPVGGFGFVYWYPNKHILRTAFNSYDEHAIHLFMTPADAMLEKNPTALPVGYHTHISLSATHTTKLQVDELGRNICQLPTLRYFDRYTYANCQVECLIDNMLEQCNCTGVSTYGKIPQDKLCSPIEALNCYKRLAYEFTAMLVQCRQQKCQEECDYWSYRPSLTVGKVFNPIIADKMQEYWRLPEGDPSLSLIIGDVYFDEIQYHNIIQKPALTIDTFISSIGGSMGLWTGASIITWIHLLYFCIQTLCASMQKRKQKKSIMMANLQQNGRAGAHRTDL